MRIVIRLRFRRGDYVPVCPAGLQYLAFPSLGGPFAPSVLLGPSAITVSCLPYSSLPPLIPFIVYFVLVVVVVAVLERGKKKIRDDCRQ